MSLAGFIDFAQSKAPVTVIAKPFSANLNRNLIWLL